MGGSGRAAQIGLGVRGRGRSFAPTLRSGLAEEQAMGAWGDRSPLPTCRGRSRPRAERVLSPHPSRFVLAAAMDVLMAGVPGCGFRAARFFVRLAAFRRKIFWEALPCRHRRRLTAVFVAPGRCVVSTKSSDTLCNGASDETAGPFRFVLATQEPRTRLARSPAWVRGSVCSMSVRN